MVQQQNTDKKQQQVKPFFATSKACFPFLQQNVFLFDVLF